MGKDNKSTSIRSVMLEKQSVHAVAPFVISQSGKISNGESMTVSLAADMTEVFFKKIASTCRDKNGLFVGHLKAVVEGNNSVCFLSVVDPKYCNRKYEGQNPSEDEYQKVTVTIISITDINTSEKLEQFFLR